MELSFFQIIAFSTLLLAGLVFFLKKNHTVFQVLLFLTLLLVIQLFQTHIQPVEKSMFVTGLLSAFLGINLLGSYLIRHRWLGWLVPGVSVLLLLIVGKNDLFYNEYTLDFSNLKVTGMIVLGVLIGIVGQLKYYFLHRFFAKEGKLEISTTVQIIATALFLIPATFFVSWFGIVLVAIGHFIFGLYNREKNGSVTLGLISIAMIYLILSGHHLEGIDLTIGKVLAGLVMGVGMYELVHLATKTKNNIILFLLLIAAIACVGIIALLDAIHPAYGGVESFVAAFLAVGLLLFQSKNESIGFVLVPAFAVMSFFLPKEALETQSTTNASKSEEQAKVVVTEKVIPTGVDASALSGSYSIDAATSLIEFQMGPKGGVTKGAIKNFEGKVNFQPNLESSSFMVTMAIKNLTTFSRMRDKSIWSDEYLNEPKFPIMTYISSKMTAKEDGYVLDGTFKLMGISNKEEVFLKYVGTKDNKEQFWGKASIDRRKYGMASSPQEGDIVDFTFTIELIKQ